MSFKNAHPHLPQRFGRMLALFALLLLAGSLLWLTTASAQAAVAGGRSGAVNGQLQVPMTDTLTSTATLTPTLTHTATLTPTLTQTPTETATPNVTPTPTNTATVTQTSTNTATGTQTATTTQTATVTQTPTVTRTPTITQTPSLTPSSTSTGTITPAPTLSAAVSPSSARVNDQVTYTIKVKNAGPAPAFNSTLVDSYAAYLDVQSVTTTKGTASKSAHAITVTIGDLMPNEEVTITVVIRVNSSLPRTETASNGAVFTYNGSLTRTASASFSAQSSTTLPSTGQISPAAAQRLEHWRWRQNAAPWAGGLALLCLALVGYRRSRRVPALVGALLLLVVLAAACLPSGPAEPPAWQSPVPTETSTPTLMPYMPAHRFSTPEAVIVTLPAFTPPAPEIAEATPLPGQPEVDDSPVIRVVIPRLNLDAVVKYVPFEQTSWYITGLREEIAWLGETSWPGLGGNTVLAGHVTVAGLGNGPFFRLEDLQAGDTIRVYTQKGAYTYSVRSQAVVEATDMAVTEATVQPQLTLITCTGWDDQSAFYRLRRVVFADLTRSEIFEQTGQR